MVMVAKQGDETVLAREVVDGRKYFLRVIAPVKEVAEVYYEINRPEPFSEERLPDAGPELRQRCSIGMNVGEDDRSHTNNDPNVLTPNICSLVQGHRRHLYTKESYVHSISVTIAFPEP
jgi:hypothetical protein